LALAQSFSHVDHATPSGQTSTMWLVVWDKTTKTATTQLKCDVYIYIYIHIHTNANWLHCTISRLALRRSATKHFQKATNQGANSTTMLLYHPYIDVTVSG